MSLAGKCRECSILQYGLGTALYRIREVLERWMLKIHRSAIGEQVIFALSGRMDSESTVELENLIGAEPKGQQIVLDLKDLTLAGQSDIDFLVRCEVAGVKLVSCAHYIRAWIAGQQGGK